MCFLIGAVFFLLTGCGEKTIPMDTGIEETESGDTLEEPAEAGLTEGMTEESEEMNPSAEAPETEEAGMQETVIEEGSNAAEAVDAEDAAAQDGAGALDEADAVMSAMSLEDKICQLFFITPEQLTKVDCVTAAGEITRQAYSKYPVGGMIYFAQNLKEPGQTAEMLAQMDAYARERSGLPVFLAVDEEGGRIVRIAENDAFGVQKVEAMEHITDEKQAFGAGFTIGSYLKELGFNLDFAPVADVLTNPENTVVRDRSFGTDPGQVKKLAAAYSDGLHDAGILSTYKHFPGHGATSGDTHEGYDYTGRTYEEMLQSELVPFAAAGEDGADFVMAAHIAAPAVTGDDTPCSLSPEMLTDILRNDLGYEGIVITDALNMGAIVNDYPAGEASVRALEAGADMLLMPQNFEEAYQAVYAAVQEGRISEDRLNQSVSRIIRTKLAIASKD